MSNVTCLRLSDVSVICRVTYFQFPIQSTFLRCRSPGSTAAYVIYPISDIGRCEKFGKYVSCTERTFQENDLELILTLKLETRHPVEGSLGSEFSAICSYCVVFNGLKSFKFCENFLRFWKNDPFTVKFSKFRSVSFHRDTDRRCFVRMS